MLQTILKNKRAQQTAEYALLISLVVAAVVAMQTYAQRALQGRIRQGAIYMKNQTDTKFDPTGAASTKLQYAPYYLTSEYQVTKDENTDDFYSKAEGFGIDQISNTTRDAGGFKEENFNTGDTSNW